MVNENTNVPADVDDSNIKIYRTKNYDLFKKLLGNRDNKTEGKIIDSITKIGYVVSPAIVNENYEVIDGQNRIEAAKQLGEYVYFIIEPGLGIEQCRYLNIGQSNWGYEDYIVSYAKEGNPSYQRLRSLINSYKKQYSIEGICCMANPCDIGETGSSAFQKIKVGKYRLTREMYELACTRLSSADDLGYTNLCRDKKLSRKVYWSCVSYVYQHQGVRAEALIEKLREYSESLHDVHHVTEMLHEFDEINNKGVRPKNKVFLSTDFQCRKYMDK